MNEINETEINESYVLLLLNFTFNGVNGWVTLGM